MIRNVESKWINESLVTKKKGKMVCLVEKLPLSPGLFSLCFYVNCPVVLTPLDGTCCYGGARGFVSLLHRKHQDRPHEQTRDVQNSASWKTKAWVAPALLDFRVLSEGIVDKIPNRMVEWESFVWKRICAGRWLLVLENEINYSIDSSTLQLKILVISCQ